MTLKRTWSHKILISARHSELLNSVFHLFRSGFPFCFCKSNKCDDDKFIKSSERQTICKTTRNFESYKFIFIPNKKLKYRYATAKRDSSEEKMRRFKRQPFLDSLPLGIQAKISDDIFPLHWTTLQIYKSGIKTPCICLSLIYAAL